MTNDDDGDGDGDVPQLSAETLKALHEFFQEQTLKEKDSISENWQLSQFWYDENTALTLSSAVLSDDNSASIALISCPTLYLPIKRRIEETEKHVNVILFEFDKRFAKYDPDFVFYDYNEPLNVSSEYHNYFDIIVVDPPFLSEECLNKTAQTINLIRKYNSKIILCTGSVMEELGKRLLHLEKCSFEPKHKNNLGNEFICMTNFGEIIKEV